LKARTTLDSHQSKRKRKPYAPRRPGAWRDCKQCGTPFWCRGSQMPGGSLPERVMCSAACMHAAKKYTPEKAVEVFWSRVDKNGPNGCWLWTAAKDKWGYGDLNYLGKHVQAHRLAWKLLRGDPGKLDCLHTCHNPTCCNPDHLYLGTDKENARDRVVAGRVLRGEKLHNTKLTAAKVLEIRALKGKMKQKDIAAKYGLNLTYVWQIWHRRTWKHV